MRASPVHFGVDVTSAFDYLVDPLNRPQWQSSLRGVVVEGDPTPREGLVWRDVTIPGLRPRMELTRYEPSALWAEDGTWRGVSADLVLHFEPRVTGTAGAAGCSVVAEFEVRLPGPLRVASGLLTRVAVPMVRGDLERAARILAARS